MFKRNKINSLVVAASLTIVTSVALAQEDVNVTASVTVQNAFNLAQTQALNFGTLRVTQPTSAASGTPPSITINADGTAPSIGAGSVSGAGMSIITPGVPATFTIDSAAPNTAMKVSLDASVALTATGQSTQFVLEFDEEDDIIVVGGDNDGDAYTAFSLVTDDTGAVGFALGGKLSTRVGDLNYSNTTYSGEYTVTVAY